jgi:hypothetical protein
MTPREHRASISAAGSDLGLRIRSPSPRIAAAANDNHRTHAPWRRFVAASMAALFAASLILVGMVCIARAGELPAIGITST